MKNIVNRYVRGCVLCYVSKLSNIKLGLYTLLPVLIHTWESASMDFGGDFLFSRKGHDYLYAIVDQHRKLCVLIPCKKKLTLEHTSHLFFQFLWVHFGFVSFIVSGSNFHFFREF